MKNQKLSDMISSFEKQLTQFTYSHIANNSLQRNLLLPPCQQANSNNPEEYEMKVSRHNFRSKDLNLLLLHLFGKEKMSVSDRNLLRRLLLLIFPQDLIVAGGKELIKKVNLVRKKKQQEWVCADEFCFLIKGKVLVQTVNYSKVLESGMYFGHHQILAEGENNIHLVAIQKTILLTLSKPNFQEFLKPYFTSLYSERLKVLPLFMQVTLNSIKKFQLCQKMQKIDYDYNKKICKKDQSIKQLIFVLSGSVISQDHEEVSILGLQQLCFGCKTYQKTLQSLEKVKGFFIPLLEFQKIVQVKILRIWKKQFTMNGNKLKSQATKKSQQHQSGGQQKKKFFRFKKVQIPYRSRLKTSANKSAEKHLTSKYFPTSFIFIKQKKEEKIRKKGHKEWQKISSTKQINRRMFASSQFLGQK